MMACIIGGGGGGGEKGNIDLQFKGPRGWSESTTIEWRRE